MALKVFKKGNVLAATDTITGETVRINGTFSWYSIDEVNNSVSITPLGLIKIRDRIELSIFCVLSRRLNQAGPSDQNSS